MKLCAPPPAIKVVLRERNRGGNIEMSKHYRDLSMIYDTAVITPLTALEKAAPYKPVKQETIILIQFDLIVMYEKLER